MKYLSVTGVVETGLVRNDLKWAIRAGQIKLA